MPSQIRPNRPEVNDRFPMLGFTIKTDGENKRFEVAIASDPSLFRPGEKAKRARTNFYSSRAAGLQPIATGEAVYVLPPEVLARFVGQDRLYYALTTYPSTNGANGEVVTLPSEGSAYVNLKGLTGRSLQRVRVLPNRQRAAAGYGNGAGSELEWGGDVIMPGTQPIGGTTSPAIPQNGRSNGGTGATSSAPATSSSPAAPVDYKDGFGPMPAAPGPAPADIQPAQAAALGEDIPLDPGIGGRSISADVLQIGDIILSTTAAWSSGMIRAGSGSEVSHAMLYVGQGEQVIESVGSGVRMVPLAEAIGPATLAVAVRPMGLSATRKQQVADAAAGNIGSAFNRVGIVRQALFQIDSAVCELLPESARATCRQWAGKIDLGTNSNDTFFCSELVIAAYAAAGASLTTTPPNWTSPDDIAEMFLRAGALAYVGHLKAPPLVRSKTIFEVFGLGLSASPASRVAFAKGLSVAQRIPTERVRKVQLPRAREADAWERITIEAALAVAVGPMAPAVLALRALVATQNVSVAIGPAADVGFQLGLGIGGGLIIAPGGRYGIYGHLDVRAGILDSASVGLQVTIVRGGIEAFNEVAFAVGGAFVEGIAATIEVLFNHERGFIGVSYSLGVGLSIEPFELFCGVEASVSHQVAGAQAVMLANESFSLNWDDVTLIPQPTDNSCWATAAAMSIGWRNQLPVTPDRIAKISGHVIESGISPNDHCSFGKAVGLVCEWPKCYSIDGFRALLEDYGPLWVGILIPASESSSASGHAVVVTGMYSDGAPDGSDTYVRITDPWDRLAGRPGAPGSYLSTHNTGSRYILSWDDFTREYETRATSAPDGSTNFQILRSADNGGREPRRSGAKDYAMAVSAGASVSSAGNGYRLPPPPPPVLRSHALDAGAVGIPSVITGALMERVSGQDGKISWQLDQLRGLKHPYDIAPAPAAPLRDSSTLRLEDWPYYINDNREEVSAKFTVSWQFNGTSVGNVQIANVGVTGANLSELSVQALIQDDPVVYPQSNPTYAAVSVVFTYRFKKADGEYAIAKTKVRLFGEGSSSSGSFEKESAWEKK